MAKSHSPTPDIFQPHAYLVTNQDVRGVGQPYAVQADFREASLPVDPNKLLGSYTSVTMASIPSPIVGKYIQIPAGSLSTPGLSFTTDTDTGIHQVGVGGLSIVVGGQVEATFGSYGISIPDLTPNRVVLVGGSDELVDDGGLTYDLAGGFTLDVGLQVLIGATDQIKLHSTADSYYNGSGNFSFGTASPARKLHVAKIGEPQFRIDATGGYYVDLECDSNSNLEITVAPGLGNQVIFTGADNNTTYYIEVENTNTATTGGGASLYMQVSSSGGDPYVVWDITGGSNWIMGADNSDSDKFKLTTGALSGFSGTKGIFVTSGIYTTFTPAVAASGTAYAVDISGAINTGGANGLFRVLAAASTGQTASTEINFAYFDLGATTTWATGALTNQRAIYIEAPTLAFAGASTVTTAATVYIDRAPQAGTNATITNAYALWVGAGSVHIADTAGKQMRLSYDSNHYWDFHVVNTGYLDILPASTNTAHSIRSYSSLAGLRQLLFSNTSSDAAAGSVFTFSTSGGADVYFNFNVTGTSWAVGIDNSDSDALKFSKNNLLGTNDFLTIATDGEVTAGQWLQVGTATDAAAQGDVAFGLTGGNRTFWDQSASLWDIIESSTGDPALRWAVGTTASYIAGIDNSDSDSWKLSYAASGSAALGTNDRLTILTGGNVGIGTTGPDRKLDVLDTGGAQLRLTYTDGSVYAEMQAGSSGNLSFVSSNGANARLVEESSIVKSLDISSETTGDAVRMRFYDGLYTTERGRLTYAGENGAGSRYFGFVNVNSDYLGFFSDTINIYRGSAAARYIHCNTTTGITLNEDGVDWDLRVESDDEAYCLMVEATLNNVVLCANAEPGFNSMDGGVYLDNANVVPTGNATTGGYLYAEAGALKWRGSGGTTTTIAVA